MSAARTSGGYVERSNAGRYQSLPKRPKRAKAKAPALGILKGPHGRIRPRPDDVATAEGRALVIARVAAAMPAYLARRAEQRAAEARADAEWKAGVDERRLGVTVEYQANLLDPRGDDDMLRPWEPRHTPRIEPGSPKAEAIEALARKEYVRSLVREWRRIMRDWKPTDATGGGS